MLAPGTILTGKYRIVRLVGEGSMGAVYEAEHEAISRRVAIKLLHARWVDNAEAMERFSREARAAGSIHSDYIVDVLDFGTHRRAPFIVMELLKGETLAQRLAQCSTIPFRDASRIVGQALSALAAAHAKGVIHRDLKPENVMLVTRNGVRDVVKLLDFGISKIQQSNASGRSVTREGAWMGTPAYMAPEQWISSDEVDHRADLFSAGVILYELLTGGLPFEGSSPTEFRAEIVHGTTDPPAPSTIAPEASIPPKLDEVVLTAIRRSADRRYDCAQDFLDELRPFGAAGIVATLEPPRRPITKAFPLARPRANAPAPREIAASSPEPPANRTSNDDVASRVPLDERLHRDAATSDVRARPRTAARLLVGCIVLALVALFVAYARSSMGRTIPVAGTVIATRVRIELRGVPPGAQVQLDGVAQASTTLLVPRGSTALRVEIRAGDSRRVVSATPDRDQVIVVGFVPAATH